MSTRQLWLVTAAIAAIVILAMGLLAWHSRRAPLAASIAVTAPASGDDKLSGSARDDFVRGAKAACRRSASQALQESGGAAKSEVVDSYCDCTSQAAADSMTVDQARYVADRNQLPPSFQDQFNAIVQRCGAKRSRPGN